MTNTGAIVATIKLRKERHLVKLLRERGAYSAVNAIVIDRQSGLAGSAMRGLLRAGALVEDKPGAYWLNETAYRRMRIRRKALMFGFLVIAVLCVAVALWAGR